MTDWRSQSQRDRHRDDELRAFLRTPEADRLSDREIGRRFRRSHPTVARLRFEANRPQKDTKWKTQNPGYHPSSAIEFSSPEPPVEVSQASKTVTVDRRCFEPGQMRWTAPDGSHIEVRLDPVWPKMYRVHHGGRASDMVNLSRARDAAQALARKKILGDQ